MKTFIPTHGGESAYSSLGELLHYERQVMTVFYFDPGTGERRPLDDISADPYFYSKYPPSEEGGYLES